MIDRCHTIRRALSTLAIVATAAIWGTAQAQLAPPGGPDDTAAGVELCWSCRDCTAKLAHSAGTVVLAADIAAERGAPHCVALGTDGQTFDGAGHTLTGTGEHWQSGIVAAGLDSVTIRNCVLDDFGPNPSAGYDESSIRLLDTFNSTVEHNRVLGGSDGIYLEHSCFNLIEDNVVLDSGWMGIDVLYESNLNLVRGNRVEGTVHVGIASCLDVVGNVLEQNVIRHNLDQGICLCGMSTENLLMFNYVCFNPMDIHVTSNSHGDGFGNTCDTSENWWEGGEEGCTYACNYVPVE